MVFVAVSCLSPSHAPAQATPAAASAAAPDLYRIRCAGCHGATLKGGAGPALKSPEIASEDFADLFATIKSTMPMNKPGSMSDADYRALAAYIVAQNKAK